PRDAAVIVTADVSRQRLLQRNTRLVPSIQSYEGLATTFPGFCQERVVVGQLETDQVIERLERLSDRACGDGAPSCHCEKPGGALRIGRRTGLIQMMREDRAMTFERRGTKALEGVGKAIRLLDQDRAAGRVGLERGDHLAEAAAAGLLGGLDVDKL